MNMEVIWYHTVVIFKICYAKKKSFKYVHAHLTLLVNIHYAVKF